MPSAIIDGVPTSWYESDECDAVSLEMKNWSPELRAAIHAHAERLRKRKLTIRTAEEQAQRELDAMAVRMANRDAARIVVRSLVEAEAFLRTEQVPAQSDDA